MKNKINELRELEDKKQKVEALCEEQIRMKLDIEEEKARVDQERSKLEKERKKINEEKREVYRLRIDIAKERTKAIDDKNEAQRLKERAKEFNLESFGRIRREREEAFQKGHAAAMKNYKKAFNEEYIKNISAIRGNFSFQNMNPQMTEITLQKAYKMGINEAENEILSKDQEIATLKRQLENLEEKLKNIEQRNLPLENEHRLRYQNNASFREKEQSQD